jgi:hypothetical protein
MPIRKLAPAPDGVVDPVSGLARYGSYVGSVPRVDLSPFAGPRGRLRRIAREKRWVYVAIASEDVFVALAIARFGYASTCFGYVLDAKSMRMLATASVLAPPTACQVADRMTAGTLATFRFAGVRAEIARAPLSLAYSVHVALRDIELHASLDTSNAPPAITAIASVGPEREGLVSTTEKRALLAVRGELTVGGRNRSLGGALAGYDYTNGLLPRRTTWCWAFALGRAKSGERVAFNLVQGFVGEPECAAWVDGELFPLKEGRFAFDREQPLSEWRVSTSDGAVDLRFKPGGMHSEEKNLGVVASRFVQPAGRYWGTLRVGGRDLVLEGVLGVTEDQDVLW